MPSSTFVSSVMATIEPSTVIFVANREIAHLPLPGLPSPLLPTPVNVDHLAYFLSGYDPATVELLCSGFVHGFPLHFEGPRHSFAAPNLISALQNPAVVDAKLQKELEAQRIAGPFSSSPFPVFRISPLGIVPKKNSRGISTHTSSVVSEGNIVK